MEPYDYGDDEETDMTADDRIIRRMQGLKNYLPEWFVSCYELPSQSCLFLTLYKMILVADENNWSEVVREDVRSRMSQDELEETCFINRSKFYSFIRDLRAATYDMRLPQIWRTLFYMRYLDLCQVFQIGREALKGRKSRIHPNYRFSHSLARYGFTLPNQFFRDQWQLHVRNARFELDFEMALKIGEDAMFYYKDNERG